MNSERFARARLEELFSAALEAVDPARAVKGAVRRNGDQIEIAGAALEPGARLVVLAVGKAAGTMARALEAVAGDRIAELIGHESGRIDGDRRVDGRGLPVTVVYGDGHRRSGGRGGQLPAKELSPEVIDPGTLNPGEEMIIRANPTTSLLADTYDRATFATPRGVDAKVIFEVVP